MYLLRGVPPSARRLAQGALQHATERAYFAFHPRPTTPIFVAGSERSGTTWLADLLTGAGVQQIYEPFSPHANASALWHLGVGHRRAARWTRVYRRAEDDDPAAAEFVGRVFGGRHRNYWTNTNTTAFFPRRYLVKAVNANLMLGFIARHTDARLVFISRHPCAVVASRMRGFGGVPREPDFARLLAQPALVAEYPQLREVPPTLVDGWAAEWALEQAVARAQLAAVEHLWVQYEALLRDPLGTLTPVFEWLDEPMPPDFEARVGRASHSSVKRYKSVEARLIAWRDELPSAEQRRVLAWAGRFGVGGVDV